MYYYLMYGHVHVLMLATLSSVIHMYLYYAIITSLLLHHYYVQ